MWLSRPVAQDEKGHLRAPAVFSVGQRWALLAGFTLLVIFRLPHAWVHGRFLDEEATVFLAYAWHRPWLDALFRPFAGYWNLGANATTLLVARLVQSGAVPLERAPYLTMIMALAVQLLPAVLILTGRAQWLTGRLAVVAALLFIAIMPGTEEVFLNVLHIQFHLALCAALILALDVPERRISRIGYGVILFAAPLCGPGAIVLLPLFALRVLADRDRQRLWLAMSLAAGAAVQMLLFYGSNPMRGHVLDPAAIAAAMSVRLIALPILNFENAEGIAAAVNFSRSVGGYSWWWTLPVSTLAFGMLIAQALRKRDAAIWLVLSALVIAVATFGFGMILGNEYAPFDVMAERYNFLPLVLLALGLQAIAMRDHFSGRLVYIALCILVIINGLASYLHPIKSLAQGPSWPVQVGAWRMDHHHPLATWPAERGADLSDQAHVCSPLTGDLARSTDPRYCESAWVGSFLLDQEKDRLVNRYAINRRKYQP
jgi:hypothetical protein